MYGYCRNGACLELQTNGKWKEVTPLHDAIRPQMLHLLRCNKVVRQFPHSETTGTGMRQSKKYFTYSANFEGGNSEAGVGRWGGSRETNARLPFRKPLNLWFSAVCETTAVQNRCKMPSLWWAILADSPFWATKIARLPV